MKRLKRRVLAGALCACLGAGVLGYAAYIPLKAKLGDILLGRAWEISRQSGERVKPWPWADMAPIARLEFPTLGRSVPVLDSANGQAMAWGVGHMSQTAAPGSGGLAGFGGHRDTHFAFLRLLKPGAPVYLETAAGKTAYHVTHGMVVDSRYWHLPIERDGRARLAFVTCYPFEQVISGGPLRFVLYAEVHPRQLAAAK